MSGTRRDGGRTAGPNRTPSRRGNADADGTIAIRSLMRLSDYPWIINVDCKLCPRAGRYRLARIAARLGPETELDAVLEALAIDCQWMRPGTKTRKYEAKCGIRFTDLDGRHPRPPDLPPSMVRLRVVGGRGWDEDR